MDMRFVLVIVSALATTAPAAAQEPASAPPAPSASSAPSVNGDPTSLGRIREGLIRAENRKLLRMIQLEPTFKVSIDEQDRINRFVSRIEIPKPGPRPGNGWYGYEQQRQLFNPTDRPLQQPYAAFSGGELVTVALENLIGHYAGKKIADAVQGAGKAHAQSAAQQEVERAIAEYCSSRSDRDFIQLCTSRDR
jgi:hypothetical protein